MPPDRKTDSSRVLFILGGLMLAGILAGCGGPLVLEDPLTSLRDPAQGPRVHLTALKTLDASPTDEAYLDALHRILWLPGYTVDVREDALNRLVDRDFDRLMQTLQQQVHRYDGWKWLTRVCARIGDEGWIQLTPTLVRSWARPIQNPMPESERPEYLALARLYDEDRIIDVVFDLFVESNTVATQGLRIRCWELLHRLDQRSRLVRLVSDADSPPGDTFLVDLHTGATELGIVPSNREEILWLRELCKPEYEAFRLQAMAALRAAAEERRVVGELRDLPIIVSAHLHEPDLLRTDPAALYTEIHATLGDRRHFVQGSNFNNFARSVRQRLYEFKDELTWGDLATIRIALRAMEVPQVVDHLFDFADRDKADKTTEYGGVIALDDKGRFEILEFMPRMRQHDRRYNAPQALFDAAYTSLFHFHFHAQEYRNDDFAGPGYGDTNYANNTRANCLVLTFIDRDTLNVDFYRHDRVVIDLGVINRTR